MSEWNNNGWNTTYAFPDQNDAAHSKPDPMENGWPTQNWAQPAQPVNPQPSNPWDAMNEDALLLLWNGKKAAIETAKAEEMELRKYIVGREFPKKQEGTQRKELGNGYELKAVVKYNYNLADNDTVEKCLDHISALGNEGPFIADRLVSWKPNFLKSEYNDLLERKSKGDERAIKILSIIDQMLTITEGAPTLDIVEPKGKKK